MGNIGSHVEAIDRVTFTQLRKGRVTSAKRVMTLDGGGAIVELENGMFTVIGRHFSANGNACVIHFGLDGHSSDVLDGLVKLGLCKKSDVREHKKRQKAASEKMQRRSDLRYLRELCERLEIPMPEGLTE